MKKLLFLVAAGVLVVVILVAFFLLQESNTMVNPGQPISIPTSSPNSTGNNNANQPTQTTYDKIHTQTLVGNAKNRQSLSPAGESARTTLVNKLGNKSGVVYSSPGLIIDYTATPNVFQVEILSADIAEAKQEAVSFMLAQGFSKDDLCKLPFSFYLAPNIKAVNFNPLPDGC